MPRIRYIITCFVAVFLSMVYPASSQRSVSVLGTEDFITIPFQYSQGFIMVDVIFSYLIPMKFILDTGAEHTILLNREYTDLLKYSYDKEIKIVGADVSSELKAWVVRKVPFQFFEGQKTINDIIVLETDIMDFGRLTGFEVHGILGVEFLKNFIVEISFKENVIRLYNPDHPRDKWRKFEKIPIELFQNKPYLRTKISLTSNNEKSKLFLLDTGAALALLLHGNLDSLQFLPSHIREGIIGHGIGGDIVGYSGKIARVNFGSSTFENFVASFQTLDTISRLDIIRDGIIGNYIMDHYNIVFDFPKSQIMIQERSKKRKSILFDKSGLVLYAFGPKFKNYYVHKVLEKSPAEEAGFKPGDIISHVGVWPASLFTLDYINKKLSREGKLFKMKVKRGKEKLELEMVLRDLYK